MLMENNIPGCAAKLMRMVSVAVRRGDGRKVMNGRGEVRNTQRGMGYRIGTGINFISVIGPVVVKARNAIDAAWMMALRGSSVRSSRSLRGGQPVADCLCFCGFRAIEPFMGARPSEKRGGAGSISDTDDGDSGKKVAAAGSTNVRTNSEGDRGEDCKALW